MKKLLHDARGFSHDILLVVFVAIFAIGGVAYIVGTHAQSCSKKRQAVSVVSSAGCRPVSVVSSPVSAVASANCSLVTKLTGSQTAPVKPILSITNTGGVAFKPVVNVTVTNVIAGGTGGNVKTYKLSKVKPGNTIQKSLSRIKPVAGQSTTISIASTSPSFTCSSVYEAKT